MIKALIFDMDGTIVDNIPYHFDAWLKFLANHNIHMNPDDFHAQNHGKIKEMIVRLLGVHLSEEETISLGKEKELTYRNLYKNHIKEVKGLTPLLENAKKQNLKIALATMGDAENINFIVDGLNIRHYFDVIVGGNDVEKGKPDPEIFNLALQKLDVLPHEALVFEDSHGGVIAAQAAKTAVIGVSTTDSPISFNEWGVKNTVNNFDEFILSLDSTD